MAKNKNSQDIDLSKYDDLNGLSVSKMNFGLWLSENRAKILRIIVICLIAISAFFFVYSSYSYVVYFLNNSTSKDLTSLVKSNIVSQRNVVSDIIVSVPQIFRSGEAYDLVVTIKNPNDKFFAHFNYCFNIEGRSPFCGSGFILPGEEKYVVALGQKIETDQPAVSFKINNPSWQRIDTHKIVDWNTFAGERLNFSLENVNLALANESGLSEKVGLDSLDFTVTNRTAFGYYEVPLLISFYRDSELVGVNRYVVKNFLAGESKLVRLSWLGGLPNVTRTSVRPELDLSDDSIYLKYQGFQ